MKLSSVVVLVVLVLGSCGGEDSKVVRVPLLRTSTGKVSNLDTTNVASLSVYFDFKVEALNFDFDPPDVTCQLRGASFRPASGEMRSYRVEKRNLTFIGSFSVREPLPEASLRCVDRVSRSIDLLVAEVSPKQ